MSDNDNEMSMQDYVSMFSADRETFTAAPPLQKQKIASLKADRVDGVMASYAISNDIGSELSACGILTLKADHGGERGYIAEHYASFRAWNDYTGWGCQDGVDFHVGTFQDVLRWGLGDQERRLLGYEQWIEREGWGDQRQTEDFGTYEER